MRLGSHPTLESKCDSRMGHPRLIQLRKARGLVQQFQGERIGLAGEVLLQRVSEDRGVWGGAGEKGHGGAELEVVGRVEDLIDGPLFDHVDQARALLQAGTEDRVAPEGHGFLKGAHAVEVGVRTVSQAFQLGKDEPDPVAALLAGAKLGEDLREDAGLGA